MSIGIDGASLAALAAPAISRSTSPDNGGQGSSQASTPEVINPSFQVNEKTVISGDDLRKAVEILNQNLEKYSRNVRFSVDGSTGKDVVRVVSSSSGEIIRQLPNDEMLNFIRNLDNMIGLIFNKKS
jgi:flagellar protein FlaG